MALISSLKFHSLISRPPLQQEGLRSNKCFNIVSCKNNNGLDDNPQNTCVKVEESCGKRRRELLLHGVSALCTLPAVSSVALAAQNDIPEDFRVYTDEANKFKISIPQDWQVGIGDSDGVRALIAFYPQETSNSNGINTLLVITGLGADFTKLESFGKVDEFAETLVSGLDRSWQRPAGVAAKLIDSKAKNGLYYIEYTLKNPGESRRHLYSVLGVANNGFYNRLYTLTGQCVEEDEDKFGPKIQKAVSSFRLI